MFWQFEHSSDRSFLRSDHPFPSSTAIALHFPSEAIAFFLKNDRSSHFNRDRTQQSHPDRFPRQAARCFAHTARVALSSHTTIAFTIRSTMLTHSTRSAIAQYFPSKAIAQQEQRSHSFSKTIALLFQPRSHSAVTPQSLPQNERSLSHRTHSDRSSHLTARCFADTARVESFLRTDRSSINPTVALLRRYR